MLSRHLRALVLLGVLASLGPGGAPAALAQTAQPGVGTPSATATTLPPLATSTPTPYLAPGVPPTASATPATTATPTPSRTPAAAASPTPGATPTPTLSRSPGQPERFFGAVQALYNPTMAAQAGVQWERVIFPWSLIQKSGPDAWDQGYFSDDQVRQEVARGVSVVGLAIYTPQWATSTPRNPKVTNVPANLYLPFDDPKNYWGQFMFKLASRYKGLIDTWIVWNEPDMISDQILYTWDGSLNDFYQLVKVAYQAVKKANPDAKIALPGTTYWWDHEAYRPLWLARFLQTAATDPSAPANNEYFDIVTIHQYTNPLNIYAALQVYQRTLAQFGVNKPIWVGESNVVPYDDPQNPIVKPLHATMDEQASYILEAFALARAGGAQRMSIYKMVDEAPEGAGELFGLVHNDGSPRPAYNAFKAAIKFLSDPTTAVSYSWEGSSDPPTPDEITRLLNNNDHHPQWIWPAAVNRVMFERAGERISVVWNASGKLTTAHIPAVAKSGQVFDKFGNDVGEVVAHDGRYSLELYPSTNNTDFRDPSLLLVGGDPRIIVEKVTPLPDTVDAPIEVVWAKDAISANITGVLLQPGGLQAALANQAAQMAYDAAVAAQAAQVAQAAEAAQADNAEPPPPPEPVPPPTMQAIQPVPCRWNPTVRLYASIDGGPTVLAGTGTRRMVTQDGVSYPVWDFNNVDIGAANQGKTIEFWLDVGGVGTRAIRWVHARDGTPPPQWQQKATRSCSDTP